MADDWWVVLVVSYEWRVSGEERVFWHWPPAPALTTIMWGHTGVSLPIVTPVTGGDTQHEEYHGHQSPVWHNTSHNLLTPIIHKYGRIVFHHLLTLNIFTKQICIFYLLYIYTFREKVYKKLSRQWQWFLNHQEWLKNCNALCHQKVMKSKTICDNQKLTDLKIIKLLNIFAEHKLKK